MNICAYSPLLYGRTYLAAAIRSVIDMVDNYYVLYTPQGSYGTRTDVPCPETRDELMQIAYEAAGDKLHWYEGNWTNEGEHRMTIHQVAPDADVLLALDSDEVWGEIALSHALAWVINGFSTERAARNYHVPMIHYWRSFYRAVIDDKAYPTRIIVPSVAEGHETFYSFGDGVGSVINHLGYAQSPAIVDFKLRIHGHRSELRDIDWYMQNRYLPDAQADCHPVSVNYWTPVAVNPLDYMPSWMQEHPNWGKDVIE